MERYGSVFVYSCMVNGIRVLQRWSRVLWDCSAALQVATSIIPYALGLGPSTLACEQCRKSRSFCRPQLGAEWRGAQGYHSWQFTKSGVDLKSLGRKLRTRRYLQACSSLYHYQEDGTNASVQRWRYCPSHVQRDTGDSFFFDSQSGCNFRVLPPSKIPSWQEVTFLVSFREKQELKRVWLARQEERFR